MSDGVLIALIICVSCVITAVQFNNAGAGIKKVSGYGTYIPTVYAGGVITADKNSTNPAENAINIIVDELNSIPSN